MEFIQDVLTYAIEAIALSALLLPIHYTWKQVKSEVDSWGVPQDSVQASVDNTPEQNAVVDPWEVESTASSPRYWVRPQSENVQPTLYLLPPAKEEVKPTKKPRKTKTPAKPRTTRKRKAA